MQEQTVQFSKLDLTRISPFYLLTTMDGQIRQVGRSIQKLSPVNLNHLHISKVLEFIKPTKKNDLADYNSFLGQLVIVELKSVKVQLIGELIFSHIHHEKMIFWKLSPVLRDSHRFKELGLTFNDFSVSDPIFDFMMLLQSEKIAAKRTIDLNLRLEKQNLLEKALSEIVMMAAQTRSLQDLLRVLPKLLVETLGFSVAHVLELNEEKKWKSAGYIFTDSALVNEDLTHFFKSTLILEHQGIPFESQKNNEPVISICNLSDEAKFPRAEKFKEYGFKTALVIPVYVSGKRVSIIELFNTKEADADLDIKRFLRLCSEQIARVAEREIAEKNLISSAKLSMLGEMASGIVHEINNPLTIIQGRIQLMIQQLNKVQAITAKDILPHLEKVLSTSSRIAKIIKGMKILSRNADHDPFEQVVFRGLLEESISVCSDRFKSKSIQFELSKIPDCKLYCRPTQISQVMVNILNNATDAAENYMEKWIKVDLSFNQEHLLIIRIIDSGIGIPKEMDEKIMQPFFTTKSAGKGTGLGLSISNRIIEDHGGKLYVDHFHPNTCFVIELPAHSI